MRHDELADSLIQARTRRNIAGGAEGKHLQGSKLERRIRRPGASRARTLPPTSPTTDPHPVSHLAPCTGISAHTMHAALHCRRFGLSRRAGRRLPPTINHALLTSAASDPRRRLQVMKLAVTVATGRQCRHPLYTNRGSTLRHATPGVRMSGSLLELPAGGSRHAQRPRPVRPVFDSGPHRSTSGVPTWLDSACGMLTVKR